MKDTKLKLLILTREHCVNESIVKSDLMMLINITWNKSFAGIDENRRCIADRERGSFNRNILTSSYLFLIQSYNDRK